MKTALLVVDIQNDFLPGGALAVDQGHHVVPLINELMQKKFNLIVASKDWHPADHCSFADTHGKKPGEKIKLKGLEQILWPVHCVQDTPGSEFSPNLDTTNLDEIFFKGTDKDIDSYSAFYDNGLLKSTGLGEYFKSRKVTDVYIAGLTTDYCVKFSVLDAIQLGFTTHVILDACRPVNLKKGDSEKAVEEMREEGADIITTKDVQVHLKK